MHPLDEREIATYEAFLDACPGDDLDSRLLWQLIGQLEADEVLVWLPEWLPEEQPGFVEGAPPTGVTGRIERDTDQASCRPIRRRLGH